MIQKITTGQAVHKYEVLEEIHATSYYTYIETGVLTSSDISIYVKYKCPPSKTNNWPRLIDSFDWNTITGIVIDYESALYVSFIGYDSWYDTSISWDSTSEHEIYLSSTEFRYDGQTVVTRVPGTTVTTGTQMWLGCGTPNNDWPGHVQGYFNYYGVKIWDNDVLIRDFVPVKRLSDNKYGMYDYVNDQFYSSAGTQEFTGTSKSTPTYIDELQTGVEYVNDIVMVGSPTTEHKYEVLDYVITPSQSSVNTEVLVDGSVVVDMVANIASGGGNGSRLFSSNDTNSDWPGWYEPGTWGLQKEGNYLAIALFGSIYDGSVSSAVMNTNITWSSLINKKLRYNLTAAGILNVYNDDDTLFGYYDVTAYSDPTYVSSTPIKLFIRYADHEYIPQNSKIYDVKIWKNNDLIKHYVPAKRLSDSVYGFYDLVDGTFHPNDVSGYSFTGVSKSVPEYIDKEIANPIYINRIYLDGDVYWGNGGSAPTPPSPVPSQYTVVEYIRSTGTSSTNWSYINTGLYMIPNMRIEYSVRLPSDRRTNTPLWGWVQLWGAAVKKTSNNRWDYQAGYAQCGNPSNQDTNPTDGTFYLRYAFGPQPTKSCTDYHWFKLNNYQFGDGKAHYFEGVQEPTAVSFTHTVEGVSETRSLSNLTPDIDFTSSYPDGTSATSLPFYLFGAPLLPNDNQYPRGFTNLDVFYFKIYDGTTPLRDFVPVYDTVSQKYGLYDKVTQAFYGSSTSVNFTGPSIS